MPAHPLTDFAFRQAVERAASVHLGRLWSSQDFVDLDDLASHRSGIFQGEPISVFAKLATDTLGRERFVAELEGLTLIHERRVSPRQHPSGHESLGAECFRISCCPFSIKDSMTGSRSSGPY
jgi:hypothetical protein